MLFHQHRINGTFVDADVIMSNDISESDHLFECFHVPLLEYSFLLKYFCCLVCSVRKSITFINHYMLDHIYKVVYDLKEIILNYVLSYGIIKELLE